MNEDFSLTSDSNIIPAQYSENIKFHFEVLPIYKDSLIVPGYLHYDGCTKIESTVDNYNNGEFTIPANAFSNEGVFAIAFAITTGEETVTTTMAEFVVRGSVSTSFSLPNKEIWQTMLQNFMDQYMDKVYTPIITNLIDRTEKLQSNTAEIQKTVNGLIKTVNDLVADVNKKINDGDFTLDFKWEGTKLFIKKHTDDWAGGVDLSGATTISLDDTVQTNLTLSTTSDTTTEKVKAQFKTFDGKIITLETTADMVKTEDGTTFQECLKGIGFYCGKENGSILLGPYEKWFDAGKPVMTEENKVLTTDTQVYSTEETDTGKVWIDGQPIYRKVVVVEINGKPNALNAFPTNIDAALNYVNIVDGVMEMADYAFNIYYSNNEDIKYNIACYYNKSENAIVCNFGENRLNSVIKKITFIIEYTKL